ncbi:MAG UNVERIFIED_CONTAM: hypothetical protein LVR18_28450 [Planctomycetaceae bacterium]
MLPISWFQRFWRSCQPNSHRQPPKLRGLSPKPGPSVTNTTVLPVPAVLAIVPAQLTPPTPKAAGTVPETGAFCNEYYRSTGSSGSGDRAGPTHTTNPQSCGDCPRNRGDL